MYMYMHGRHPVPTFSPALPLASYYPNTHIPRTHYPWISLRPALTLAVLAALLTITITVTLVDPGIAHTSNPEGFTPSRHVRSPIRIANLDTTWSVYSPSLNDPARSEGSGSPYQRGIPRAIRSLEIWLTWVGCGISSRSNALAQSVALRPVFAER